MIDLSSYVRGLKNQKIAVFGLGLSGLSTVRALIASGAHVHAWDDSQEQQDNALNLGAKISDLTQTLDSSFDALVLSPGVALTHPAPHDIVKKAQSESVSIIGDIDLLHHAHHGLKTIGITGTNGKSTTTALMAHVLNQCGVNALAAGNIGMPVLDLDLKGMDVLVLELSSYQLDLCHSYTPDISILLNITPDHLDRHGDMAGYTKAKSRILKGKGLAIIGIDDQPTKTLYEDAIERKERDVVSISVLGHANIYVQEGVLYDHDKTITDLRTLDTLKGVHNHQNIACVYAAAKEMGLQADDIMTAIKTYGGLPHRQFKVAQINNVTYINDSKATNSEAASKALSSYDNIYWIVGGLPKVGGLNGLEQLMQRVKKAYLIGQAAPDFKIWLDHNNVPSDMCGTLDVATKKAHEEAQLAHEHGTVLLAPACASWDQFKSFEVRGHTFMQIIYDIEGKK
ncbi:MAG: UDP-N-acetylmuramoyl-L-alanine--D-glutamate ligase [Alphaproteobacteria bacterium]|nr:UDP-N-acetylmuramoyl-L-alanine--D-glutamate ligase [Alphaproteobacteria bacterium]NCQ87463.1 UDP-N-acetylmuramoyl-L-alanine--D-glutamate ligase [Alphaproteobacteria bacterium]NCT06334.1 UDP-N-acetylmuramoyl-L-alanine--D-glutamate ligase [Alphaproteobacteria bacterium]